MELIHEYEGIPGKRLLYNNCCVPIIYWESSHWSWYSNKLNDLSREKKVILTLTLCPHPVTSFSWFFFILFYWRKRLHGEIVTTLFFFIYIYKHKTSRHSGTTICRSANICYMPYNMCLIIRVTHLITSMQQKT
jgi:hypothetical protein